MKFWRVNGHKIIIGGNTSYYKTLLSDTCARETLLSLGFGLAKEKCQWNPKQQETLLGHNIDMMIGKLFITEERIDHLEMTIGSLLYRVEKDHYSLVPEKALASVVGQTISLQNVIGNKVRLPTRQMFSCILSRASWEAPVRATGEAKSEVVFWKANARSLNASRKSLNTKIFMRHAYLLMLAAEGM